MLRLYVSNAFVTTIDLELKNSAYGTIESGRSSSKKSSTSLGILRL